MTDAVTLIRAKRDGHRLSGDDIRWLFGAYAKGEVADEQMSALLMAIYFQGLDGAELRTWTAEMIASGDRLDLAPVKKADRRQALHRRGGGQGQPDPRAAGRGLRRRRPAAVRARPRPYRRHAGQAGVDPRIPHRAEPRGDGQHAERRGLRHLCRGLGPGAGRPPAVRAAGRDRDGRVHPAHRQLDHVEEDRRGHERAGPGRQGRHRRVHEEPRPGARAGPDHGRAGRGARRQDQGPADQDGRPAGPRGGQRRRGGRICRSAKRRGPPRPDGGHARAGRPDAGAGRDRGRPRRGDRGRPCP